MGPITSENKALSMRVGTKERAANIYLFAQPLTDERTQRVAYLRLSASLHPFKNTLLHDVTECDGVIWSCVTSIFNHM